MRYEDNNDLSVEHDYISEITAVFTTANARVRLYAMLDWLHPSQICYCDTDSIMFLYDKTNPEHKAPLNSESNPKLIKFGDSLGDWSNEFTEAKNIIELVVAGAKSYSYITNKGKIVIKQKGVTLDVANLTVVTFEAVRDMVLNDGIIETKERFNFRWDNNTKDVRTIYIGKSLRSTVCEKRVIDGYDTKPFGFSIL